MHILSGVWYEYEYTRIMYKVFVYVWLLNTWYWPRNMASC